MMIIPKIKILITGASGFIGQHLLEDLLPEDFEVRIITRQLNKSLRVKPDWIEIMQADLNDLESLKIACVGIDCVVNIAAEVRNVDTQFETNVTGTENLINAIIKNNIKKVIHISSVGVVGLPYSNKVVLVDEITLCNPNNGYEKTKKVSEDLFLEASLNYNFQLVILRPTNVFGEFHPFNALLNLFQRLKKNHWFLYEKNAIVNYLYVKDLTQLIVYLIKDYQKSEILNVGESVSLEVLVNHLSDILKQKVRYYYIPQFLVTFINLLGIVKVRSLSNKVIYSDDKLKHFFKYPFGLKTGLKRTITYYNKTNQL